ncbi:tetraspanin-11-like [Ricinus communis]|uniref:tetraspanin-11-like n=1 Tax=Ricinus communis TaxID=3988 RepID=UPI00201B1FE5|nr:tetraspanin-11-like [Ricinus communis]
MARISNILIVALNAIFLLIGLCLIIYGISSHMHHRSSSAIAALTACQQFLLNALLILGVFVALVSLLGLTGAYHKSNWLLALYLILLFFMIVGAVIFMIFLFAVTNETAGKVVSHRGFKEYRLGDYSHWLQNHFAKGNNWEIFRSCLVDSQACSAFSSDDNEDQEHEDFLKANFSPLQDGCCQPPAKCGFIYRNTTFGIETLFGPGVDYNADTDCRIWNDNHNKLCYSCNSCKVGFLATVRNQWRHSAVGLLILIAFKILVFCIGCCARRNNSIYKRYPHYRSYP